MTQLRKARVDRGWSQARLIHALRSQAAAEGLNLPATESMRILVSRWENGHAVPDATYRRLLGAVLHQDLVHLGFGIGHPADVPAAAAPCIDRQPSHELVAHLHRLLRQLAHGDNALGGAAVLASAECEARALPGLVKTATGSMRADFFFLASRFAEFCGWLRQDVGDMCAASQWSELALRLAREGELPEQMAYVLMRTSNLASDLQQARPALDLADAAFDVGADLSPQATAVVLRQRALAHSLDTKSKKCLADLAAASDALTRVTGLDERASYVTEGYVASEAALCSLHLGRPAMGEALLRPRLPSWPQDDRRDRGLALARLAATIASNGRPDEAVPFLDQAVAVARSTASARLRSEVQRAGRLLPERTRIAKVDEVKAALAALP